VGAGVGVNVVTVQSNVAAEAGGTIYASGPVKLHSQLDEDIDLLSVAGAGGLIGLSASVAVVTDRSTNQARIGDFASVNKTSALSVQADTTQNIKGMSIGAAVGVAAVGASFVVVDIGGDGVQDGFTRAQIGHDVHVGDSQKVGSVNVSATDTVDVDSQSY